MSNPVTAEWGDRIYLRYRVLDSNGDLLEESDQTADGYELGNSDLPDPVQLRLLGAAPGTPISILMTEFHAIMAFKHCVRGVCLPHATTGGAVGDFPEKATFGTGDFRGRAQYGIPGYASN